MKALIDYENGLTHNLEKLQLLLTSRQYVEAVACMDERMVLISELTKFAKQRTVKSAEIATLAGNQLAQEQVMRYQIERLKNDVMAQLDTINKANKLKSVYGVNK